MHVQMRSVDSTKEFTTSKAWAQDTGLAPGEWERVRGSESCILRDGSWHYARITPMSTVTDRKSIGMTLKEKRGRKDKRTRIVVERLEDNEDGSTGAAEKAGTHPLSLIPTRTAAFWSLTSRTDPTDLRCAQEFIAATSCFKSTARRSAHCRRPMLSYWSGPRGPGPTLRQSSHAKPLRLGLRSLRLLTEGTAPNAENDKAAD